MSSSVVILSGGLDSTTCLYWARERHERIHALFINWRQKSLAYERESSRRIAEAAGATWKEIGCPSFDQIGTKLTEHSDEPVTGTINFYTRGLTFLAVAARYVEATGADALVVGYTADDALPESTSESVLHMERAIGVAVQRPFRIEAPLLDMHKDQIVMLARSLPGCWEAMAHSVSCFAGTRCGECKACLLRAKGFAEARFRDPAA